MDFGAYFFGFFIGVVLGYLLARFKRLGEWIER